MFLMDTLSRTLTFAFLITSMLSVGMQATMQDLRSLLASKGLLFRALVANFIVVPIIGIVLVKILPLKPEAAMALLILACTPGGISALQFTTKARGEKFFAGSTAFLMSLLAVFLSPVLLTLTLPGDISVVVPYGRALLFIVVFLLLPLVAGMLVSNRSEQLAGKLSKVFSIVSVVLFIAVVLLLKSYRKEAMNAVGKEALLYMLLFIVLSMVTGWLMAGRPKEARPVLATVTSMRNVALCLLIALKSFPDPAVQTPLVAFSALMVPPNMLLTLYWAIRSKKKASV
jgi:bile acid:Na+ symporter, BASS family